jgi:large subunit ribosomal protein L9
MKVVLRDDVENVGVKGDVVDVAPGYARNFLVPRGLAIPASTGVVRQAEAMRRNRTAREQRLREAAEAVAARLAGQTVEVRVRAGEAGKLFGSVTNADLAEAIATALGVEVDRRAIDLAEPIKELGEFAVVVRLHADVTPAVAISVVAR